MKHMTFVKELIQSGYVFDDENYDGCYVKTDSEDDNDLSNVKMFVHLYQEGEDDNEWNYVKMTEDFDVITETTFTL